jgi:chromosome segregation ATPase
MDSINIIIRAILEKSSKAQLETELKNIENRMKPIEVKTNLDTKGLDKYKEKYVEAENSVSGIAQKTREWAKSTGETVKQVEHLNKETGEVYRRVTDATINYKKQRDELAKINAEQSKYWSQRRKETLDSMTSKPDELVKMAEHYKQLESSSDNFNNRNINAIDYQIKQREIEAQQFSKVLQAKMLQETQEKKITAEIHKQSLAQQDLLNRIRGMRGIDGKYIVGDNLNALNQLETQITGFDPTNKNFSKNMDEANSKLKEISTTTGIYKKQIQDANKYTGLFGQSIFEAGNFLPHYTVMYNCKCGEPRNLGCIFNV